MIKHHTLRTFQRYHKIWLEHNFPDQLAHDPLLGLTEELGELAHAHLKREQGIRGSEKEHQDAAADAIGDIMIYLASYCNTNDFDMAACLEDAWEEVSERDWQRYPKSGVAPEQPTG